MRITVSRLFLAVKCFCVTFILVACIYQIEPLPSYNAAAQSEQGANSQTSPTQPPPLSSAEHTVSGNDASPATDKIKRSEWMAILINAFIALVILWQAWIYNQQRRQTRIAERAYVGVKTCDLLDFIVGCTPRIRLVVLNGGRTPLWNLFTPGGLTVDVTPPDDFIVPEMPKDEEGGFLVAGATGTVEWLFPRVLTSGLANQITSGQLTLYLRGEAWFEDCWKEKRVYPFYLEYNRVTGTFDQRKKYAEYMEYRLNKYSPVERKRVPK